ncbi:MAG: glycosyltransferase family 9 protein [Planctomycetes bacterium]|nr:glycosyltransferase family 9 protein [Planctomycetota bacterium]
MPTRVQPPIERLLIVRLSAMGDVVHSLSALERARELWPETELWWVVERLAAPVLEGHPALDGLVVLERKEGLRSTGALRRSLAGLAVLREKRFEAALDLQGLLRSALVARASGARRVLGPAWAREGARFLYSDRLTAPRPGEAHAAERYRVLVERAAHVLGGSGAPAGAPSIRLPESLQGTRSDSPRLVVLPGAGKEANRLPPALLGSVVDACAAAVPGLDVLAVGGPGDGRRAAALRTAAKHPVAIHCGGALKQSARQLSSAWAVLGGDTGPLHLARALGIPTLGLFPAADPARTGPAGTPGAAWALALAGAAPCAPCLAKTCQRPGGVRICLDALRGEEIAALLLPHLQPTEGG